MNHIPAALKIAFKALRTNKMRSALTMLGMVVGVGAVIAMVAVGQGASEKVQSQIESLGSNLIVIQPGFNNTGGVRNGWGNGVTLTRDDAVAIGDPIADRGARGRVGAGRRADRVRRDQLVHPDPGRDGGLFHGPQL